MPDSNTDNTPQTAPQTPPAPATQTAAPVTTTGTSAETKNTDNMIPKSRFDEVNEERKAMAAKIAEYEAAQAKAQADAKAAEEKRLADQQEWQKLAEQKAAEVEALAPFKANYEAMIAQVTERNTSRIAALSDDDKEIVPKIDDPVMLAEWLDKYEASVAKRQQSQQKQRGNGTPSRFKGSLLNGTSDPTPTKPIVRF